VPTAVIDIGTNTLLLLVVDDQMKVLADLCEFGRLGAGLDATRHLSAESIDRSLEICRRYRAKIDELGATHIAIVGTQALREASNRDAFVGPAEQILGAPIEVISGAREAELSFLSVARTFPELAGSPYVVVDVGGGSTEIVASDGDRIIGATSVPIGAVRLTERHLKHDPPTANESRALFTDIDAVLGADPLVATLTCATIVATAGTATTLAALAQRLSRYDAAGVTGYKLATMSLDQQLARLFTANLAARREMRGMEPGRADVIAGGAAILSRLVHRLGAASLITADRGVRWGLAYTLTGVSG